MPEISVIVPVFNTEPYLVSCLESIQRQDFRDFEVILINDGSTDQSLTVLQNFARQDSRFSVFSQENAGLSAARNLGLKVSTGNWITFVDSDDVISPTFLKSLHLTAEHFCVPIAVSGKQTFQDLPPKSFAKNAKPFKISSEDALVRAFYQKEIPDFSAWNKLYHKSLWEDIAFPCGIFFEDMATIPRLFAKTEAVGVYPAPLYGYRTRSGSILRSDYDLKKTELLDIAEKNYAYFKSFSPAVRKAAESLLFSASFSILMRTPENPEFTAVRERAFKWIREWRFQAFFNPKNRMRNKVAALLSLCGKRVLPHLLRRFG